MIRALALAVLSLSLLGTSCIKTSLERCDFADVEGMTGAIDEACWAQWCFEDKDGDLHASVVPPDEDGECPASRITEEDVAEHAYQFGDCDDDHANIFPGNLEVCDGFDNDCDDDTEFALEGEQDGDLPRCSRGKSARLFLAGGSRLAEQDFNAASPTLEVVAGQRLEGTVNLQIVTPEDPQGVAVVAVASWGNRQAGLKVLFEGEVTEDLQVDQLAINFGEGLDVDFTAPSQQPEEEEGAISVIIAVADLGPVGTGEHLASLTWPRWCCENVACDQDDMQPCDAVWDDPDYMQGPPEEGMLPLPPQLDLASLDSLVLASCATLGAAQLPLLLTAQRHPTAAEDECTEDADPAACQHIYSSLVTAGCVEIQMELEGSEDGEEG